MNLTIYPICGYLCKKYTPSTFPLGLKILIRQIIAFNMLNHIFFVFRMIAYTFSRITYLDPVKAKVSEFRSGLDFLRLNSQSLKFTKIHRTPILNLGRDDEYPVFGRSIIKHFR